MTGWFWGVVSSRNHTFPYNLIKSIYKDAAHEEEEPHEESYIETNYESPKFIQHQIQNANNIYTFVKNNPIAFRNHLKNLILLPKNITNIIELEENEFPKHQIRRRVPGNSKIFKATYYGISHFGILEKSIDNIPTGIDKQKKLLVYHQGHGANPYNSDSFLRLKEMFKEKNYDVLSLSMTGLCFNDRQKIWFPVSFTTPKKSIIYNFNPKMSHVHAIYRYFHDEQLPNISPIALMLSGNYYIINHIIRQYDEVIMIGISGGGWYTSMLSSLIPEIQNSYSFAGSIPKAYRIDNSSIGDWEQTYASIWNDYDYWHFYLLSLFDELGDQKRNHYLIYNNEDPTSFSNPAAKNFNDLVGSLSISGFKSSVLKNDEHVIDIGFVEDVILK